MNGTTLGPLKPYWTASSCASWQLVPSGLLEVIDPSAHPSKRLVPTSGSFIQGVVIVTSIVSAVLAATDHPQWIAIATCAANMFSNLAPRGK